MQKKKARINVTLRVNVGFSFIPSFLLLRKLLDQH